MQYTSFALSRSTAVKVRNCFNHEVRREQEQTDCCNKQDDCEHYAHVDEFITSFRAQVSFMIRVSPRRD